MWLLHVVLIQGQQGWQTGLVLWLVIAASGATFAVLSGEWWQPDALLVDLALAGAGGARRGASPRNRRYAGGTRTCQRP